MRILVWLVTNVAALAAATWLVDGIRVGGATRQDEAVPLVVAAVILGLVNSFARPLVRLLSLPLILLTLGLFLLVINALMLLLTGWLADRADLAFRVDGFWSALLGGIIVTVVTWIVGAVLERD